jgi:hypothetical protein
METSSEISSTYGLGVVRDLSPFVRARLDAYRYWQRRREQGENADVSIGSRVRYKDEPNVGVVMELLDGTDGRKSLIGRRGWR